MAFASVPLKTNTVFASANRINATESADQNNYTYRGVIVVIDLSTFTGGTNATFTIEGKDPESGKYYTVLASAAQTAATGDTPLVLQVYPGMAASANAKADAPLPKTWRIKVTKTGTFTNLTYSASATMIP